ncbi:SDR family oxidoreductase [Azospirillum sp. RWY-5-1]|uniref:SDR family oxidoreductase n=1 Tax=Azospirillum oleiclasticum TaxID=2735135 RepID=A0ABX2TKY4_9PROT|nr:SDR family oxidoreductase [Azospirillum oleiclasticum]NYZ17664.1 SDR family oxidoreductase [Azospirillum oleiclasticum]NYZ25019.1 SDR family oxidoreductase [Azospirillum oleiclasticum]
MSKKTAIVFGGSRGIGAACVQALAGAGYDVAYTYVSSPPADLAGVGDARIAARIAAHQVEITDEAAVAALFDRVTAEFGAPHCVVANAGINVPPAPVGQFPTENFRRLVEVNIVGAFNILRAAAQRVADGGSIVALTTSLVRHAAPGVGPYAATKAAVECLVRSMAKELAPRGVRVNGVAPGPVDTDLFRAGKSAEMIQRSAALSPFNRVGRPEEVAAVVRFLASDEASWVHGQIVQPNGGLI